MPQTPQVFISYARDKGGISEQTAVALHGHLTDAGVAVFRDVESIDPGDHWASVIERQILASRVMVVVVSRLALDPERWVMRECLYATSNRIPLIPLLVEQVQIPLWLTHINVLDFTQSKPWNRLLVTLGQRVAEGKIPSASPLTKGSTLQPTQDIVDAASPFEKGGTRGISPPWASDVGSDKYGRYADLTVEGVTQRFRWIEPGIFWMGSSESEKGREPFYKGSETRHQVTLTKGFWLADTACTQALWKAVMDDNPAHFQDNLNNPVEQVSWLDVQEHFLLRLKRMIPDLKARLPTEAEWEYACRAGTTGAFNFMGDLSLSKINYRGTWDDYDKWGEAALERTAPVKSYAPNHWGLYEMHGNVCEWCQDAWQEKLPAESATDPQGTIGDQYGVLRVIRGGSWNYGGSGCRSACRSRGKPDERYGIFLEKGVFGVTSDIRTPFLETCETCNGSGAKSRAHPQTCPTCHGNGQVRIQQGFFATQQTCPHCQGSGKIIADPCPDCQGQGHKEKVRLDNSDWIRLGFRIALGH